ncbi:Dihydroxy-acid dehydratase [Frankliniella fusca]|uniref:Dihydroxy-acid dehydratase n=1 Tax=Frankliniella fusca TaxID=407009 RepID=A0AAE1GTE3_9NEOP|nr:Dihydroxy-acid dehydratase [Frankliniella fusca]
MPRRAVVCFLIWVLVGGEGDGDPSDVREEHTLAHANCFGLAAELIASDSQSLLSLLHSEDGRRAAKDNALRALLANATSERAVAMLQDNRGISICGNAWLDWIPWIPCRVQSPPPRPPFQDEERGGDGEGPLCWTT